MFQWQLLNTNESVYKTTFIFPISFTTRIGGIGITDFNTSNNPGVFSFYNVTINSSIVSMRRYISSSTDTNGVYGRLIMVGY